MIMKKSTGKSVCTLSLNMHCQTCMDKQKFHDFARKVRICDRKKKMKWHNHMINEFKVQLETNCLLKTELVHR